MLGVHDDRVDAGVEAALRGALARPRLARENVVGGEHERPAERAQEQRVERLDGEPLEVDDAEIPALFRRADLVVLPYREIDQSGVLYAALGLGRPLLLSSVGGFPEVAAAGTPR